TEVTTATTTTPSSSSTTTTTPLQTPMLRDWVEVNCCVIMKRPIEKILIRYERVPNDYLLPFGDQLCQSFFLNSLSNNDTNNLHCRDSDSAVTLASTVSTDLITDQFMPSLLDTLSRY